MKHSHARLHKITVNLGTTSAFINYVERNHDVLVEAFTLHNDASLVGSLEWSMFCMRMYLDGLDVTDDLTTEGD
jgi:hypothetical protein